MRFIFRLYFEYILYKKRPRASRFWPELEVSLGSRSVKIT